MEKLSIKRELLLNIMGDLIQMGHISETTKITDFIKIFKLNNFEIVEEDHLAKARKIRDTFIENWPKHNVLKNFLEMVLDVCNSYEKHIAKQNYKIQDRDNAIKELEEKIKQQKKGCDHKNQIAIDGDIQCNDCGAYIGMDR